MTPAPTGPQTTALDVLPVLDRYPGTDHPARTVTPIPAGATTRPWLVDTPTGRYVLRCLPPHLDPARARFIAAVQQHASVLPQVPAVIATHDGDLVAGHAGHRYLLTAHAPGTATALLPGVPSHTLCQDLGLRLGHLHQVLRNLAIPSDAPRQRIPDDPAASIRDAIAVHRRPGCPHHTVRQVLAEKLRLAHALHPDDLATLRALPATVIHGDIHPGNVLTTRDTVTGIIDFDLARCAPPAYELIRALIYCLHPAGPVTAYGPRATAFLTGYLTAATLTRHEMATMTRLYEITQIIDVHGLAVCHRPAAGLLAFGHVRYALLYWLRRNGPELTRLAVRVHTTTSRR